MNQLIIQFIGFIGLAFTVWAMLQKTRSQILHTKMVGKALFTVHFWLLGAGVGMAMNGICVLKEFVLEKRTKQKWANTQLIPLAFILVNSIAAYFTWEGWYSSLALGAAVMSTLSSWQKSALGVRILLLISRPLWVIYGLIVHSYAGIATALIIMGVIIIGIYKHDLKRSPEIFE